MWVVKTIKLLNWFMLSLAMAVVVLLGAWGMPSLFDQWGLPAKLLPITKAMWFLIVLVGVTMNAWTLREAWIDFEYINCHTRQLSNIYLLQAFASWRKELAIFVFQIILLGVRFWAQFWPSPGNLDFSRRWVYDATIISLAQLMLSYACILDLRDRRLMMINFRKSQPEEDN